MVGLSTTEIERLRTDTPGCENVVHFNHAGASLMPRAVIEATIGHLQREAAIGGYEAADEAEDQLEAVYASTAKLINAQPNEIAIIENATRAWDMAFYAIPLTAGDRILTSRAEYASNVIAFLQAAERGVSIEVVPNDEHDQLSVSALQNMLDDRVKIVAISHMPTNGGLVQPAEEIGRVLKGANAIYLLDACQTVGQMPIDVAAIGCDVLSAASRKYLRGPRGVGFLYVRNDLFPRLTPPFLDLHAARWTGTNEYEIRADARRFENWESFVAGRLGMAAAVDLALTVSMENVWDTVRIRAEELRYRLSDMPGITVQDLGETRGGIVTFSHKSVVADDVKAALDTEKINTVSSSVSSTRYDMEARGLTKLVRASVHYITTPAEIETLANAIERITA